MEKIMAERLILKNTVFENTNFFKALNKVISNEKISIADAYRINKIIKQFKEYEKEYQEVKVQALQKYGDADPEQEGYYIIPPENKAAFQAEISEVLAIEHDFGIDKPQFPNAIKEGVTVADINELELVFDFSNFE